MSEQSSIMLSSYNVTQLTLEQICNRYVALGDNQQSSLFQARMDLTHLKHTLNAAIWRKVTIISRLHYKSNKDDEICNQDHINY